MEFTSVLTMLRETRYFLKYALITPEISYRIRHSAKNIINLDDDNKEFDDKISIEEKLKRRIEQRLPNNECNSVLEEDCEECLSLNGSIEPKLTGDGGEEEEEEEEFSYYS